MISLKNVPNYTLAYLSFSSVATVIAGFLSLYGKKQFLRSFAILSLARGLLFIVIPSYQLPRSTSSVKFDGLHVIAGRLVGIGDIMFAGLAWSANNSPDPSPRTTFMWSYLVGSLIKVILRAYMVHKTTPNSLSDLTEQEVCDSVMFLVDLAWIFLMVYHLYHTRTWGGYSAISNQINFHIRLEQLFCWVIGLYVIGFPNRVVREISTLEHLDKYHTFLGQSHGANYLILAMIAGNTVHYISNADKAIYLLARTLESVAFGVLVIHSYLTYPVLQTSKLFSHLFGAVLFGVNTFLGYGAYRWPDIFQFVK